MINICLPLLSCVHQVSRAKRNNKRCQDFSKKKVSGQEETRSWPSVRFGGAAAQCRFFQRWILLAVALCTLIMWRALLCFLSVTQGDSWRIGAGRRDWSSWLVQFWQKQVIPDRAWITPGQISRGGASEGRLASRGSSGGGRRHVPLSQSLLYAMPEVLVAAVIRKERERERKSCSSRNGESKTLVRFWRFGEDYLVNIVINSKPWQTSEVCVS
jgi:hypothetical protein